MNEQRAKTNDEVGVGMLGYRFMGRAHAAAYHAARHAPFPPAVLPRLIAVGGRREGEVAEAAATMGFPDWTTDWRDLVADDRVQVFDNSAPNAAHHGPTIAAARAGKHVVCEKPLGRDAAESFEIWEAAELAGVCHMCAFNYRFVPAIRLAREMLEAGELGDLYHFRGRYLQDWLADPDAGMAWRLDKGLAGSGALGDIGAHLVDLARYLVGEPASVAASAETFIPERPGGSVDVDDAIAATVEFESGAIGTWEASRMCHGRKNSLTFEISGSKGSLAFDLERLNELEVYAAGASGGNGFRRILVTEPDHPYLGNWWPPGHMLGWEHTFTHELSHFLTALASGDSVAPHGATFEDGYRAAEVCDAVERSAGSGQREQISYRELSREPAAAVG